MNEKFHNFAGLTFTMARFVREDTDSWITVRLKVGLNFGAWEAWGELELPGWEFDNCGNWEEPQDSFPENW